MSLRDEVIKLADEQPELVGDLFPVIELAVGASCCFKPRPAPDHVVLARLQKLAFARPDLRPHLDPLIKPG